MTDPLFKNIEHLKKSQLKHELNEAWHEVSLQNEVKAFLLAKIAKLTTENESARFPDVIQISHKENLAFDTALE